MGKCLSSKETRAQGGVDQTEIRGRVAPRRFFRLPTACFRLPLSLVLGLTIFSAHGAVDEDFMRSVEDSFKSADSNIGMKDAKAASADVKELELMFKEIVDHYIKKGDAADGVKLSQKSLALTETLVKTVAARDFESAASASVELGRTCKSCHTIYKE